MKNKLFTRQRIGENLPFILAFLLPILILLAVFAGKGIFPFGDKSFLRVDLYHQYAPFMATMEQKLHSGGSLGYTWNVGLGTNFLSLYGYYLASPFNWLLFFCPSGYVIEFLSYLVVFKTGLIGLFFAVWLSRKSGRKDYLATFFSIFFALSGYFAAYNWNIMWIDCIMLTPLILMGLERLVEGKGCWFYCVSLGLCILTNYYISIMVCMFCVLYFLVLFFGKPGMAVPVPNEKEGAGKADKKGGEEGRPNGNITAEGKIGAGGNITAEGENLAKAPAFLSLRKRWLPQLKILFNFCFYSLLAGGLAACILVPEFMALKLTASGDFSFPKEWRSYFSIFDMLARHMAFVDTEIGLDHWPNIYCGTLVFVAVPLYYANTKISGKMKWAKTVLMVFMLFSFSTNIPNYIWHGFHYPNSLPCRQSFLYIAVLLSMCYEAIYDLKALKPQGIALAFAGAAAFIVLCEKLGDGEEIPFYVYYLALVLLALYALLAWAYKGARLSRPMAILLLLCLASIEACANTAVTSITTTTRSSYIKNTAEYRELIRQVKEQDPGFYRFEKYSRHSKNDGAWVGYPSASIFSSTANAPVTDLYKAIGLEGSMNAYAVTGMTPFITSIFNIKYLLSSTTLEEKHGLLLYEENNGAYLYQNQYALPLGFMVPEDFAQNWDPAGTNAVIAQNTFAQYAAGIGNMLDPIATAETNGGTFSIYLEEAAHVFVLTENSEVEDVDGVMGERTDSWSNVDRGFFLDLGWCEPGDEIRLTTEQDASLLASAYSFRYDNLNAMAQILNNQPLEVTSYSDTEINGTIQVQEDGLLFTSIPYDNGWVLDVDGVETEIEKVADALIAVPLSAGSHELRLSYHPPGKNIGMAITAATVLLISLMLLYSNLSPSGENTGGKLSRIFGKKRRVPEGRLKRTVSLPKRQQNRNNR